VEDLAEDSTKHRGKTNLYWIAEKISIIKNQKENDSLMLTQGAKALPEDFVAEFLEGHMMYIMHFAVEVHFAKGGGGCLDKKESSLKSLSALCEVMGPRLQVHIIKICMTIKVALDDDPRLVEPALRTLHAFVSSLGTSNVGVSLPDIVVLLLPHIDKHTKRVVGILEALIVEGEEHTRDHFLDITFMPNTAQIPALKTVNAVLDKAKGPLSLEAEIRAVLRGVSHDSETVVRLALHQLSNILRSKRTQVNTLVLQSDTVAPCITATIETLLKTLSRGTNRYSRETKLLLGQALGEIGSIDPARVPLKLQGKNPSLLEADSLGISLLQSFLVRLLAHPNPNPIPIPNPNPNPNPN